MPGTPLGILDLVPVSSGSTAADALRNSIDLARHAERLGYTRYWFAEHHLNPGVAGTSPAILLALTASATSTIRLGSGAVQLGHRTALSTVEEFGLIDALHPGRLDLGLGRSGPPRRGAAGEGRGSGLVRGEEGRVDRAVAGAGVSRRGPVVDGRAPNGLLIPPPFSFEAVLKSPRFALQRGLLQLPGARSQDYAGQIDDLLALLAGTYRSADGEEAHVVPGEGAGVEVWILGSSGGESAEVAGARGLRFAANYHVSPASVLDAVDAYREHFEPSAALARPYVSVSADVVVAEDEARARELATGYPLWVRSIRTAEGAIPFPTPEEARAHTWTDEDRALVQDRVDTQFTGTAAQVADRLEQLQEATEADELLVTTITHDHTDRVRSYRLLAQEWARRGHSAEPSPGSRGSGSAAGRTSATTSTGASTPR
ncbi:LLM class flavin-dependent oxidoreductase [Streptomyces acidiscabies]|uniref:LLM class flavin-dependent oxidoreductase n=1 Tax=Streptomyces acidiscabies TaxID=42234 RepID=UPI0038F6B2DB